MWLACSNIIERNIKDGKDEQESNRTEILLDINYNKKKKGERNNS